ncbi:MAG: hypothetical protein E7600_05230 [Ruminococcaceae bacterium]|nr:hypothetical protein [Oscillospiraceae bacterium]
MLKRIMCIIFSLTVFLAAMSFSAFAVGETDKSHDYIIHGGGKYKGHAATNSLDALENAYAAGNRYIELDFNFTHDLRPVCIHDWNYLSYSGYDGKRPTLKEFSQNTVYSSFKSMTLEDVADYMRKHKDLYIITDVKDLNIYFMGIIQREFPDLRNRFIVQVYSEIEYSFASRMKFDKIIFSLYKLDWNSKTNTNRLVEFAKNHRLYGYTFPSSLCDIDGYVDKMLESNTRLFVHTVNDKSEQQKYFDMGISGVYTDNVTHN